MKDWLALVRKSESATEFNVQEGNFSALEIRQSSNDPSFSYFYDTEGRRLITDFVLHNGPQVATLCTVTLIRNGNSHSPRLKFWKKDKNKAKKMPVEYEVNPKPPLHAIKALVDVRDGHENLWTLINFLQTCKDVKVPESTFRIVGDDSAHLADLLSGSDKDILIEAVRTALGGRLSQDDINLIADRKGQLERFNKLLTSDEFFTQETARLGKSRVEDVWQAFFEENTWIFGYGLNLVACRSYDDKKLEKITTGASLFGGAGKRSDAVLRTRGAVSSLLFCEIKKHDTKLLAPRQYREPDVYQPSGELVGAVAQVQKTADKALRHIGEYLHRHRESDGTPASFEIATIRPRQVVVVGKLDEFEMGGAFNSEKVASFEFFRRSVSDTEIITFDELYERARFIVGDE
jgi:hypothetical protein